MRRFQWLAGIVALMACMVSFSGCEEGQKMMEPLLPNAESEVVETPSDAPLKLYWSISDGIRRADLNGSNIEDVVVNRLLAEKLALDATHGKVYWTERSKFGGIFRANLSDGTNIEPLITDEIGQFSNSIALDIADGKMYWTNDRTNSIFRANLEGTNAEEVYKIRVGTPLDIALDVAADKMYWSLWIDSARVQCANLDGSNLETLIDPLYSRASIALDIAGGKMYSINYQGRIGMLNLDGSNVENFETPDPVIRGRLGITLNLFNDTMYWIGSNGAGIWRSNLDGSQQQMIIESIAADIALYTPAVETEVGEPSDTTSVQTSVKQ